VLDNTHSAWKSRDNHRDTPIDKRLPNALRRSTVRSQYPQANAAHQERPPMHRMTAALLCSHMATARSEKGPTQALARAAICRPSLGRTVNATWANCERRNGGARQREGSSEKHGNTYALRQGLFNDGLGERPICT